MADLTTTITESVVLNGSVRGSTNTLTTTGINNVYERIVTCTHSQETTLVAFNSNSYGAVVQLDKEDVKYIRVTNLSPTIAVEIAVVGAATLYQVTLPAGSSHILPLAAGVMLAEADTDPSFGTMADLQNITIKPVGTTNVDIEVFVASI